MALLLAIVACTGPVADRVAIDPVPVAPPNVPTTIRKPAGFPEPPMQHAAWTAPDGALGSAAARVFELGLADPRGCDYRAITIVVGTVWGNDQAVESHGWVLPGSTLAIGWDGLVHPTQQIGAASEISTDVAALLAQPKQFLQQSPLSLVSAMLLVRLGKLELAQQVVDDLKLTPEVDRFGAALETWAWLQFEQGITAHMRGDVQLALESWRRLPKLRAQLKDADYLDDIDALVADEQRRIAAPEPAMDEVALLALHALPQRERIAKLVAALDQVAARQMGQPGGVALGEDKIIQALVAEGEPAVEPLLAAFETDDRRTRSVQFWRDFDRHRTVLSVYEAAFDALGGILDLQLFQPVSTGDNLTARGPEGRKQLGEQLRTYWQQWRGVPMEERWYRMFADDTRDLSVWLDVAEKIVQPSNVTTIPSSSIAQYTMTTSAANPSLRGEPLRAKQSPSVNELFERRLRAIAKDHTMQRAQLALAFARWDNAAAAAELATTFLELSANPSTSCTLISQLTLARARGDDAAALADYAGWIVHVTPSEAAYSDDCFEPMIEHTDDRAIERAAKALFADKRSPWVPLPEDSYGLLDGDLVHVPAFRVLALAAIDNRKTIGKMTVEGRSASVEVKNGMSSSSIEDRDSPPNGFSTIWRVTDEVAERLTRNAGVAFERYWPLDQRDAAIAQITAWLRR
ncbi:MAG TPA: hypothetical protein VH143_05640 [Kofleriaceae bacterium]|nr:hypothetical protein [Kofleriaceae bacterium]